MKRRNKRRGKSPQEEKPVKVVKAVVGSLFSRKTSESWMGWSGIVLALLQSNDTTAGVVNGLAGALHIEPTMLISGLILYATGRVVSKVAKA